MVQPKYSPEEALQRIKLMMEYDSSKTLTENKLIIEESCPNSISYSELKDISINAGQIAKKMDASFVRMGYGEERASELYSLVKSLIGKNVIDDITGECSNALEKFKENFKKTGSKGWFEDGFDLETKIREFINGYYSDDEEVKRYLNGILKLMSTPVQTSPSPSNEPSEKPPKNGNNKTTTSKFTPCSGTYHINCKSPVIAKVQGCLGGLIPDGKFGNLTLGKLKEKGYTTFTDADVDKICGTTPKPPVKPTGVEDLEDDNSASTTEPF